MILALYLPGLLHGQTFESVSADINIRGIAEDQDQLVLYGNGLTWINSMGDVRETIPLIDGMAISDIIDVASDKQGGLWVLTSNTLGYLTIDRKIKIVFTTSSFGNIDATKLKRLPDGTLLVLLKDKIIEVKSDFTYSVKYQSTDPKIGHFKMFDVDSKGNIYIGSFTKVYTLDTAQQLKIIELPRSSSLQRIQVTDEQRVLVLENNQLFELSNDQLVTVLAPQQLGTGVHVYEGEFKSINDYWLYSDGGNTFHYKNGIRNNYTSAVVLKTGNFGEGMYRSAKGEIWMTMSPNMIFLFDGSQWAPIDVNSQEPQVRPYYINLLPDGDIIAGEKGTSFALIYTGSAFKTIDGFPLEQISHFKKDLQGNWYWSTKNGIFTWQEGKIKEVVSLTESVPFEFIEDQLLYGHENQLKLLKDGTTLIIDDNIHHLGWQEIYGLKLFRMFDGKICAVSTTHQGVIGIYDGTTWEKIISIEGKKIGAVFNMHTWGDKTYIITHPGSVALYDSSGWHWLYQVPVSDKKSHRSYLTTDDYVWYVKDEQTLMRFGPDKSVRSVVIPVKAANYNLQGLINTAPNVYTLYLEQNVLKMDLSDQ